MKKILMVLNYYYPYISGVSEYARLVAEEFVKNGDSVTVITSNHANLAKAEIINGVRVIRTKVWFRISKGTISPMFILKTIAKAREYDVVNLHLPMLESGIISLFIKKNKLIATYQCDINLTPTLFNKFIVKVMDFSHNMCLKKADKILMTTLDYGRSSRIAYKYINKVYEARAPIKEYYPVEKSGNTIKRIGFCGRIVEEKGIDVLLEAYNILSKRRQDVELVIAGDYKGVAGGSIYPKLIEIIERNSIKNVKFIGKIFEEDMADFYSGLDVFVLPSINSLEAFGMVQVEAMFCGIPVVASDLPGVSTIVTNTGMGEIHKRGDAENLAEKIEMVLNEPDKYKKSRDKIQSMYGMKYVYTMHRKAYGWE